MASGDHIAGPIWVLTPRAIRLLDTLPSELRLIGLRRRFPHVLNQIALAWHEPANMQRTMQSLLIDQRGQRDGFPADVAQEISDLADYYFKALSQGESRQFDVSGN